MRVVICGPRDMTDYHLVFEVLDGIHKVTPITALIEGGALGADRFGRHWAESRGVPNDRCPVDPAKDGAWPAAGPRRNSRMLREKRPDRGVAFIAVPPTPGTADMVKKMKRASIPVMEIVLDG